MECVRVSTSESPLLSIIIVAYKSRAEIEACLASLPRRLAGGEVEVVLVDNSCAADGTLAFVRERFPWVQAIDPGENLGFGRANNLGFARLRGRCVLFLNPDTVCNETALEHGVRRVCAEPEIGMLSLRLVMANGEMDLACRRSIPTAWDGFCRATGLATRFSDKRWAAGYNLTHLPVNGTYEVGAINGAFMLGRREVFAAVAAPSAVDVFDPQFFMYGDDLDLCIRVARAGWRIVYDGSHQIVHLKGQSVARDYARMSTAIFDANRDVYLKHFNPRNSAWVRWRWTLLFGTWKQVALWRARLKGHRRVRPV